MNTAKWRNLKLSAVAVCLLVLGCAGVAVVSVPSPAPALQGITGIDALMGASCATNWRRSAPHVCTASPIQAAASIVGDNTCRALSLSASFGVSTASQVGVIVYGHSTAAAFNSMSVYNDSACTSLATSWGVTSAMFGYQYTVPFVNGTLYYKGIALTLPTVGVVSYYD